MPTISDQLNVVSWNCALGFGVFPGEARSYVRSHCVNRSNVLLLVLTNGSNTRSRGQARVPSALVYTIEGAPGGAGLLCQGLVEEFPLVEAHPPLVGLLIVPLEHSLDQTQAELLAQLGQVLPHHIWEY